MAVVEDVQLLTQAPLVESRSDVDLDFWQFVSELAAKPSADAGEHGVTAEAVDLPRGAGAPSRSSDTLVPSSELFTTAQPSWDPVPSAPQFLHAELISNLAEDLKHISGRAEESALLAQRDSCLRVDNELDSKLPEGNSGNPESFTGHIERKRATNRANQRSFRQRQRERTQAVEAQLASTMQELQELKARQQQLEAKNLLLEKLSTITQHRADDIAAADVDALCQRFADLDASNTICGRGVVMTVNGRMQAISVQRLATMELPEFARIWTAYIAELAKLLLQLGSSPADLELSQRLQEVTIESSQLMGIMKPLNLKVYKAILEGRLDEGLTDAQHILDDQWYMDVPKTMALSSGQVQDLLYLRKLYLTKRCHLAMQRDALIREMRFSQPKKLDPGDMLSSVSQLATRLRQNAAEDYLTYCKVACAGRRGVVSTEQWATLIVSAYPYFCNLELILEGIAQEHGDPTVAEVLAAARHKPLAAEWAALDQYVGDMTKQYYPGYVPVYRTSAPAKQQVPLQHSGRLNSSFAHMHQMLL